MITFVLAESALELIPESLRKDPRVIKSCRKFGKRPEECLLDKSLHYWAMNGLKDSEKRGRPDIVYHVLLDVTSSQLYRKGLLDFYIHTYDDNIIKIGKGVRPPKAYFRFEGLMVDLFRKKVIEDGQGNVLLELRKGKVKDVLKEAGHESAVGFEVGGELVTFEAAARRVYDAGAFIIGGFPAGSFSDETTSLMSSKISVAREVLDADAVVCRVIYELERLLLA